MTIDHQYEKTKGKEIIEVLIKFDKSGVWMPLMATQVYLVDKNGDINKVQEIRVRNLKK